MEEAGKLARHAWKPQIINTIRANIRFEQFQNVSNPKVYEFNVSGGLNEINDDLIVPFLLPFPGEHSMDPVTDDCVIKAKSIESINATHFRYKSDKHIRIHPDPHPAR